MENSMFVGYLFCWARRTKTVESLKGRMFVLISIAAVMLQPFVVHIYHIDIDMVVNRFTMPLLSQAFSITAIFAIISICLKVEQYHVMNVFGFLGRNSLAIMCLHTIFIAIYVRYISGSPMLPKKMDFVVQQCFIWIPMLIQLKLINKYCLFLVGKE